LTLTEDPMKGNYTLQVKLKDNGAHKCSLHKGDYVLVNGTMEYDIESYRYYLEAQEIVILKPHEIWKPNVTALVWDYYLYENARIQLNASFGFDDSNSILYDDDNHIRAKFEEEVNRTSGDKKTIEGYLRFDKEGLFYYVEVDKIF
jgi:hypothetical protein